MRVVDLPAGDSPAAWGQCHGESFRGEIQSLAEIRLYLTVKLGGFVDRADVLVMAERHLSVLKRFDRDLYDELCGIARGANTSPAHIVVVNHYTDLRDIKRSTAGRSGGDAGGCTVLWTRTERGPIAAQTWDMHATAIPYVTLLRVPERGSRPGALLFTITGCVGMAGMNQRGVSVTINNLHSTDARVGIVWPVLVRRALAEPSAERARDVILDAPIGSGHHYLVADRISAFGIETSGTRRSVLFSARPDDGPEVPGFYIHTNHCLDSDVAEMSRVAERSTTHDRYRWLHTSLSGTPVADVRDAWARLGSDEGYPRSICTNMSTAENPHGIATCGAIAMELGADHVWAQSGLIHNVSPQRFDFRPAARRDPIP
ncbi:MAG: C45 family peptidase [Proteobacteria bacterium]|nr:C45 family peptidase [Pseudomonadota bacterium]